MKTRLVVGLVAGALLVAGAIVWWQQPAARSDTLTLYGNVDIRQVSLAFERSDRVTRMAVEEGQPVQAGQVLAQLDTRTLELQAAQVEARIQAQAQAVERLHKGNRPQEIAEARAQLEGAQADRSLAASQLARLEATARSTEGQAVSPQDLDAARTRLALTQAQQDARQQAHALMQLGPRHEDIAQAEAQLAALRAERALIQHQVELSSLKAPQAGVVRSRLMEAGDLASPQRPAYTLALTSPKWVRAYVTETELGRIKPDMAAQVSTDSHPDQPIAGQVGYISSVAEFTPKSVQTEALRPGLVYEVRILLQDPDDRLRLGMPATVRIPLAAH
jgi:HlyD family secretion protein